MTFHAVSVLSVLAVQGCLLHAGGTDVVSLLCDRLAARGETVGYEERKDRLICVGHAFFVGDATRGESFLANRSQCVRRAELKAKADMLQTLSARVSARQGAFANRDGAGLHWGKMSAISLFAEGRLPDWRMLDACEAYEAGKYAVAVAVVCDRAPRNGNGRSETWINECKSWVLQQDVSGWDGTRTFVDSKGGEHLIGIGVDVATDSDGMAGVSYEVARQLARKNLLLGLYGDVKAQELAKRLQSGDSSSGSVSRTESFFDSLICMTASNDKGLALVPVFERRVRSDLLGCDLAMVMCCADENVQEERAVQDRGPRVADRTVKVFNPATGRFEQVTTGGK